MIALKIKRGKIIPESLFKWPFSTLFQYRLIWTNFSRSELSGIEIESSNRDNRRMSLNSASSEDKWEKISIAKVEYFI
jgi:hypothetical protein